MNNFIILLEAFISNRKLHRQLQKHIGHEKKARDGINRELEKDEHYRWQEIINIEGVKCKKYGFDKAEPLTTQIILESLRNKIKKSMVKLSHWPRPNQITILWSSPIGNNENETDYEVEIEVPSIFFYLLLPHQQKIQYRGIILK